MTFVPITQNRLMMNALYTLCLETDQHFENCEFTIQRPTSVLLNHKKSKFSYFSISMDIENAKSWYILLL